MPPSSRFVFFFENMTALAKLLVCVLIVVASPPASALDNGLGKRPPLGWCAHTIWISQPLRLRAPLLPEHRSTWLTCADDDPECTHDYCDEEEVKSVAMALQTSGLAAAGYDHVLLDDCWASSRDESGSLTWDADRFPSGIPVLIDWLHERGFRFGL